MKTLIISLLLVPATSRATTVVTIQPHAYLQSLLPEIRKRCKSYSFMPQDNMTTELTCIEKPGQKLIFVDQGVPREAMRRAVVSLAQKVKNGTATAAEKDALLWKLAVYLLKEE